MKQGWKAYRQRIKQFLRKPVPRAKRKRHLPLVISRWLPWTMPKLRLSHQLLGFFVVVVLFPLLLLSFSIYSINQKAVRKQVAHFTERTAEATYDKLRMEIAWQQEHTKLASEYWRALFTLRDQSQVAQWTHAFFQTFPDYDAIALYDPTGKRLALIHEPSTSFQSDPLPAMLIPLPGQVTTTLTYHPLAQSAPDMAYTLQIIVPGHWVDHGQPIGAMGFFKRFPYLGNLIRESVQTFNNGFVIVDEQGRIIAGPPHLVSQSLQPQDLAFYQSLEEGVVKSFSSKDAAYGAVSKPSDEKEDAELEKVFVKIPALKWGIVIESPYRIQRHYIARARAQSVALVFLCILVIVLLGVFYSSGINRNFRQMIKGIKALAEGNYSRKIRLITKSWTPYEIVYLTAEFNRMATKISSAWSSIQQLNQELVYKNQQDLFIAQATQRLHSSLELESVCKTATTILLERPEIRGVLLYLQGEPERLELAAHALEEGYAGPDKDEIYAYTAPWFPEVLAKHRSMVFDASQFPRLAADEVLTIHPVHYQESPLGVLVLIKAKQPAQGPHSFDDALMIDLISSQIGVAIHQSRQWMQLQKANQQLAKLDDLKSNLIDTVSHELRTPLTNIKGYTSRLIRYENTLDSNTKIKSLKVIKQQADRLSRLVEDLLVIPDLERQGGIRVFPDRLNLHELMTRCTGFIQDKANRNIQILELSEDLDILVDPDRMEQVILNLLDNASKYSLEDSTIEVTAYQASDTMVRIEVFNQCEPISPEELETLFSKFKRLDERLTRTTRGTGLGLFITRGLIEAMGGKIWLEGGDGFRVLMEVPLFASPPPASMVELSMTTTT